MINNSGMNQNMMNPMGFNTGQNGFSLEEQLLFQNKTSASVADVYAAISNVMSSMNLPTTEGTASYVLSIIQPQLAEALNRAEQSRAGMERCIQALIKQNWTQVMQNEKLRKEKKAAVRNFSIDTTGCGLCIETGKEPVKIGYINIMEVTNVRIEKDGTYQEYKFISYLDSRKESRKSMIPLEKLSAKSLLTFLKGFEYICSSKQIANEYLAWGINTFPNHGTIFIPEHPGFSFLTVNETEKAVFCCNDGRMDVEVLEKSSCTFKSKIMPDGSLRADEISSYVKSYLNTPEKLVLFAYCICGLLSTVLHEIGSPMTQTLTISSPDTETTKQACCYLQTYNKGKSVISFDSNITAIRKEIRNAKEETVVVNDCSRVDDEKRRAAVVQELLVLDSEAGNKPHNTAIISTHAQYLIPSEQKICLTLSKEFSTRMTYEEERNMCDALSLLIRYIIGIICQDYVKFKEELSNHIHHIMQNGRGKDLLFMQSITSYVVLASVICMLDKYLNMSIQDTEISDFLLDMFRAGAETAGDSSDAIADEFVKVLNEKVRNDEIEITLHSKGMEFVSGKPQVIIKDDLVMMEESTVAEEILPEMNTTESVHHAMGALSDANLLFATKKKRHPCTVYCNRMSIIISFIAVKLQEALDQDVQLKIQAKACEEWFSEGSDEPDMMPIVVNHLGYEAYRKYDFDKCDNLHCFITGQSGSGKTHYMTEYVVTLQMAEQLVIALDTSDSFTKEAILNNLSAGGDEKIREEVAGYVEEKFVFCKVEEDGIPVDMLNLGYSVSPVTRKKIIQSIVSASISNMGKKQKAELNHCIENLMERGSVTIKDLYEEIQGEEVSDSLTMQFEEILSAFLEYKLSEKTWGEFLEGRNGIIVISSAALSGTGGSALVDMLLMSLFYYQRNNPDRHIAVVIDEIQNQNCSAGSAITQVLKEGRKYHMSLNYATQYLSETNREKMKTMSGAGLKIYLRPDSISAKSIARTIGVPVSELNSMKQGECYVDGTLYNNKEHANRPGMIHGFTYRNFVKPKTE